MQIKWLNNSAGSIKINNTEYFLQQGHWHSPSEHSINGRRFALELHMVHQSFDPNATYKIAVIALLYRIGRPDPFLSKVHISFFLLYKNKNSNDDECGQLIENVKPMADRLTETEVGVIDPTEIKMGGRMYYRYMGSLTVPPCTEGVIWTINKKLRTVSIDQVTALRLAVKDVSCCCCVIMLLINVIVDLGI